MTSFNDFDTARTAIIPRQTYQDQIGRFTLINRHNIICSAFGNKALSTLYIHTISLKAFSLLQLQNPKMVTPCLYTITFKFTLKNIAVTKQLQEGTTYASREHAKYDS